MLRRLYGVAAREVGQCARRPRLLGYMTLAPVVCLVFFTSLMGEGLPRQLPAAIVDEDDTWATRKVARVIDAMEMTRVEYHFRSFQEAHAAMRRGEVYGFFFIPRGTTRRAIGGEQPRVSFYTNDCYLVPANLLMKEMKTSSELIGLALLREKLRQRGATERQVMGIIRPVVVETHALGNPTLDYSVYLSNILVPGILILLILLTTTYAIGVEWKRGRQREWYRVAGESQTVALVGKLLPQTVVYVGVVVLMDVWFYRLCGFPCQCGLGVMMAVGVLTVVASQSFGVFLFGVMAGEMRLAMCICSLWGILSFSLAGFTFPVSEMHPVLQALAPWFPLRHYYLLYAQLALNGFPLSPVWPSVVWLLGFLLLPIVVVPRYRRAFLVYRYIE